MLQKNPQSPKVCQDDAWTDWWEAPHGIGQSLVVQFGGIARGRVQLRSCLDTAESPPKHPKPQASPGLGGPQRFSFGHPKSHSGR